MISYRSHFLKILKVMFKLPQNGTSPISHPIFSLHSPSMRSRALWSWNPAACWTWARACAADWWRSWKWPSPRERDQRPMIFANTEMSWTPNGTNPKNWISPSLEFDPRKHDVTCRYTWGTLHGEAINSSFSSRKNEVQYCCCAALGMQMPWLNSKSPVTGACKANASISGNRAKDVFRCCRNWIATDHISPARPKQSSKANSC